MLDPQQRARLDEQLAIAARARALVPGRSTPYFAHLRLRNDSGRESDVLLGLGFRSAGAVTVIDWRTAPLAEVFFACAEGEEYEVNLGDRVVAGTVLQRNLVAFDGGELAEVVMPGATLARSPAGWHALPVRRGPVLAPRSAEKQRQGASLVEVQLDPAQRAVVDLPPGRALLILGEAGCGKTTVALHRLARLAGARPHGFRAAIIVPTEGLRRLCASLLDRLGAPQVEAWTYEQFAARQALRTFPDLPRKEGQNQSSGTMRLKRHEALIPVLARLAEQPPAPVEEGSHPRRHAQLARREDLHALFGDRALLEELAAASGGAIGAGAVRDTLEHTRIQFLHSFEDDHRHIDKESLKTSDGRAIDDGTPMEDAQSVDAEDYAVLFELERLRAARAGVPAARPMQFDCLVLDEAQELAPLELKLLGRSVAPGGTLIVAGDAAQQVDADACFRGFAASMESLGAREHHTAILEVSYRCPPEVTAFARTLRDPEEKPGRVPLAQFEDDCRLAAWLVEALRDLDAQDAGAAVAVVCRTAQTAAGLSRILGFGLPVHLALGGAFEFGPGTQVTSVQEVKGLEFDHVVLPDATAGRYPDSPEARRALYVAATRASTQLVLAAAQEPTRLAGVARPA